MGNNGGNGQCLARLYFSLLFKYGDVTDRGGEEEASNKVRFTTIGNEAEIASNKYVVVTD